MKSATKGYFIADARQNERSRFAGIKRFAIEIDVMSEGSTFEAYLESKKIDSEAFRKAESDLWHSWKKEFEQMHPNSFTIQKLNLINPIRRKYHLKTPEEPKATNIPEAPKSPAPAAPRPGRPVIKPKIS